RARLVWDFEPGTATVACTGVGAVGACHPLICSSCRRSLTVPSSSVGRRCHHVGMCGRFAVTTDPKLLAEKIQAIDEATSAQKNGGGPNYNVAPPPPISAGGRRH